MLRTQLGVSDPLVECLQDIYTDITLDIMSTSKAAHKVDYKRGVKQGCPLSPLLFSLYFDQVESWI